MNVLILCTANQCRSPMAEGLLRARLKRAGVTADVSSAGILPGGVPPTDDAIAAAAALGADISGHLSRRLDRTMVEEADLIVAMTRAHLREAVVLGKEAFPRTYTLKELVRRAEAHAPRAEGQAGAKWLADLHDGRTLDQFLGGDVADDVADPVGQSRKVYDATATEIDDLLARLVPLAWPRALAAKDAT